jgi:hypothetical protein
MSDRRTSDSDNIARDWMRRVEDRLERLENGGAVSGLISFDGAIDLGGDLSGGGVRFDVIDTGGGGREVVLTNLVSGSTSTIALP